MLTLNGQETRGGAHTSKVIKLSKANRASAMLSKQSEANLNQIKIPLNTTATHYSHLRCVIVVVVVLVVVVVVTAEAIRCCTNQRFLGEIRVVS